MYQHCVHPLRRGFAWLYVRPSSKPICDQQFLGEAQSSTAAYLNVCEERRLASTPKLPLEIGSAEGLSTIDLTKIAI
ncbi:MAG: palindromic element RPE1 domain-containing protein [Candidatus Cardinium sp.]|uniref:palindromic element RPE1 domain-containing protein n=1 Tax=Cardinium endosymbiont of Dermatophagoides farinae TaxID=2597823 RepID=UPI001642E261|nr:palindromic element RPE1 domain-containing protein [Cardinium endosymbiont of Dermatophagoides farinae]UWW96908.1 MAG: palindromic element RPE1 domain-containing protein [Candidatus Cardinium sp.]